MGYQQPPVGGAYCILLGWNPRGKHMGYSLSGTLQPQHRWLIKWVYEIKLNHVWTTARIFFTDLKSVMRGGRDMSLLWRGFMSDSFSGSLDTDQPHWNSLQQRQNLPLQSKSPLQKSEVITLLASYCSVGPGSHFAFWWGKSEPCYIVHITGLLPVALQRL